MRTQVAPTYYLCRGNRSKGEEEGDEGDEGDEGEEEGDEGEQGEMDLNRK